MGINNIKRINIAFATFTAGKPETAKFQPVNADGLAPIAHIVGVASVENAFSSICGVDKVATADIYRTALACWELSKKIGAKCTRFVADIIGNVDLSAAFNELETAKADYSNVARRAKNAVKAAEGVFISAFINCGNASGETEKADAVKKLEEAQAYLDRVRNDCAEKIESAKNAFASVRTAYNQKCADFVKNSEMWKKHNA